MKQLVSPTGHEILGTLETLSGRAEVNGFEEEDGKLVPAHSGYTKVFWEEQRTVERDGETIVLDSAGDEWPLSQCKEAEPDPAVDATTRNG